MGCFLTAFAERRHGVPGYRLVRCVVGKGDIVTTYVGPMEGHGLNVRLSSRECLLPEPEDPEPLARAWGAR